jgi:hypothetical protein
MRAEGRRGKALGEPYEGKPHVRFDEGALETEPRRRLNGHEAGNGGHGQGEAYRPPRQRPTLHPRGLSGGATLLTLRGAKRKVAEPGARNAATAFP